MLLLEDTAKKNNFNNSIEAYLELKKIQIEKSTLLLQQQQEVGKL